MRRFVKDKITLSWDRSDADCGVLSRVLRWEECRVQVLSLVPFRGAWLSFLVPSPFPRCTRSGMCGANLACCATRLGPASGATRCRSAATAACSPASHSSADVAVRCAAIPHRQ